MFSCGERILSAWISLSFLTFSKESNFFFMHLMATYFPVFSDNAVNTTEKVPLPFSYYSLYWSIPFNNKKYKGVSPTPHHPSLSHFTSYPLTAKDIYTV